MYELNVYCVSKNRTPATNMSQLHQFTTSTTLTDYVEFF